MVAHTAPQTPTPSPRSRSTAGLTPPSPPRRPLNRRTRQALRSTRRTSLSAAAASALTLSLLVPSTAPAQALSFDATLGHTITGCLDAGNGSGCKENSNGYTPLAQLDGGLRGDVVACVAANCSEVQLDGLTDLVARDHLAQDEAITSGPYFNCSPGEGKETVGASITMAEEEHGWTMDTFGILPNPLLTKGHISLIGLHEVFWAYAEGSREFAIQTASVKVPPAHKAMVYLAPQYWSVTATALVTYRGNRVAIPVQREEPKVVDRGALPLLASGAWADSSLMSLQEGRDLCGW